MDLKTRLERLGVHRGIVADNQIRPQPPKAADPPLESLIDGEWATSSGGRCFVAQRPYPLEHRHGSLCLSELLALPAGGWSRFAAGSGDPCLDPHQAVFLDVETTGMARGAGTYAFLVGLGFFGEQGFVVRQYFMPDYAHEGALLDLVAECLAGHEGLITFNGRSFDWPIVETRYVLSRREPPSCSTPHLDLLYLSRRLWRRALSSCALSSLETGLLGVTRDGIDVPGYLIPELYQDYLRNGRTRPMERVFYHNAMDLLSMVVLAARLGRALLSPFLGEHDPVCDYLSLGTFYERVGYPEDAVRAYEAAATHAPCRGAALRQLAALYKRLGRHDEALAIWRACLDGDEIHPYIELAKHFEHRVRDYEQARRIIREALTWLATRDDLLPGSERQRVTIELEYRLERVERRIAGQRGRGDAPGRLHDGSS